MIMVVKIQKKMRGRRESLHSLLSHIKSMPNNTNTGGEGFISPIMEIGGSLPGLVNATLSS